MNYSAQCNLQTCTFNSLIISAHRIFDKNLNGTGGGAGEELDAAQMKVIELDEKAGSNQITGIEGAPESMHVRVGSY